MADTASAGLRLLRPRSRAAALGLAVDYLMAKPAFAALKFGSWSRVLAGQINRGHYYFVLDERERVVGFLGWALASHEAAEAWLAGDRNSLQADASDGDCFIINGWAADSDPVNRILLDAGRTAALGKRAAYFKRYYADGRVRCGRMSLKQFVVRQSTGAVLRQNSLDRLPAH